MYLFYLYMISYNTGTLILDFPLKILWLFHTSFNIPLKHF